MVDQRYDEAREAAETAKRAKLLSILVEVGRTLSSQAGMDELFERVHGEVSRLFDASNFFIATYTATDDRWETSYHFEGGIRRPATSRPMDRGITGHVIATRTHLLFRSVAEKDEYLARVGVSSLGAKARSWMGVPLIAGDSIEGAMVIQDYEREAVYDTADLGLFSTIGTMLAMAMQNSRLLEAARKRVARSVSLLEISRAISADLELDALLEGVYRQVNAVFGASFFYVATIDSERGIWTMPIHVRRVLRAPPYVASLGTGLTGHIIATKKSVLVRTRQAMLDLFERERVDGHGSVPLSWMGVPLMMGDTVLGVMAVQDYDEENAFDYEDLDFFASIGAQLSIALQNARLFDEARRRADETAALGEFEREITSTLDMDVVLARIIESARKMLTNDIAAVYLAPEGGTTMRAVVVDGPSRELIEGDTFEPGTGILGGIVQAGEARIVNDMALAPEAVNIPGTATEIQGEKLMAAPIVDLGKVIGVMAVWRNDDEPSFTPAELSFLEGVTRAAAVAIRNARLFGQVQAARAEAEEANLAKSRFLSNTSHELRTPLNSIINFSYLLLQEAADRLNAEQKDLLGRIEESGHHLLGLINDVLDLSKIEAGRLELAVEAVDLAALVEGVMETVSGLVADRPIELRNFVPAGLPPISADPVRIRQVLMNLVSNAVKFTERGHVTVRAQALGDEVLVEVADTGIGMAPQDLRRAFVDFVQIDASPDRRYGGTGLGLPISQRLVELHGGRLWAESSPGAGSIFSFTVPMSLSD